MKLHLLFILLIGPVILNGQDSYLQLALVDFNSHNYDRALVNIDSSLSLLPTTEAYHLKGKILRDRNDYEGAIEAYTNAIEINKTNHELYSERGWLYYLAKYHRRYSINDLTKAIELDRSDPEKFSRRALLLATTENTKTGKPDYTLAILDMDDAIRLDRKNAAYYNKRGEYKFALDQKLSALNDLNSAVEIEPENAEYLGGRGLLKLLMEDYNGAGIDLTKAIELDFKNADFYSNRAHASYNLGNYSNAIRDYTQAINLIIRSSTTNRSESEFNKMSKKLRNIYLIRGSAFIQLNRNGEACDDFQRSRDLGERRAFNYIRRYCGG